MFDRDYKDKLIFHTNASDYGVCVFLSDDIESGVERPI